MQAVLFGCGTILHMYMCVCVCDYGSRGPSANNLVTRSALAQCLHHYDRCNYTSIGIIIIIIVIIIGADSFVASSVRVWTGNYGKLTLYRPFPGAWKNKKS